MANPIRVNGVLPVCILAFAMASFGCNNQAPTPTADTSTSQPQATDATNGNMAPVSDQNPPQQPAETSAPENTSYAQAPSQEYPDESAPDQDQSEVQAPDPPPELPDYSQPPAPGDDYIWTPGYWYWAPSGGYYWVPGTWVLAPFVGALWTPGYWGWDNGYYRFHRGYWGPYIGYYGGVDYGYGYTGRGYYGGYWDNDRFRYNRDVNNLNNGRVRNYYSRPVPNGNSHNRISYNGGRGGINARPTAAETAAARDRRMAALPAQTQHARAAAANRQQFAKVNHGRPASLAETKPLHTSYKAPAPRPAALKTRPAQPNHATGNRPGANRPTTNHPAANRPGEAARPTAAHPATAPTRPAPRRTASHARPEPKTEAHPASHARPETRPAARAARPEARPEARPAARPARPEARPETRPAAHAARPEARPAAHPRPEQRPQPRPAARPQAKPAHPEQKRPESKDNSPHP